MILWIILSSYFSACAIFKPALVEIMSKIRGEFDNILSKSFSRNRLVTSSLINGGSKMASCVKCKLLNKINLEICS